MADAGTLAEETRDWLKRNPRELDSPDHFFGVVWVRHKVVSIGERHTESAHRDFVASRVRHWGGPHVGLALEIQAAHQDAVTTYIKQGGSLPDQWFTRNVKFRKILEAARATQTEVVAMDQTQAKPSSDPGPRLTLTRLDRDKHMANAVTQLISRKSKVLVLAGMEHSKEAGFSKNNPPMGVRLAEAVGKQIYTIYTMTQTGLAETGQDGDELFKVLRKEFGSRGAIAFDVDRSPLAGGQITDSIAKRSISWKNYCDGLMLFFNG
ncbi:MAG: erythromycin esterase family protein [Gammaproteobacteria bacterium]|nr:erythromycin esterase family protein [Gammaproteobacteria bacterium]